MLRLDGLDLPQQALINSRLEAHVSIRQQGFTGQHATLTADRPRVASWRPRMLC